MVLSDKDIRKYIDNEPPLIMGFKESSLQSESYDLSIGKTVSSYLSNFRIIDLGDQDQINNSYSTEDIGDFGYVIGPHTYVLLSVEERINMPKNLTAHIRPRTRFTRIGLVVSQQHVNSGYSGKLNLGIYNANNFAIKIYKGMRLAQIVFEELSSLPTTSKQYSQTRTYVNEDGTKGADFTGELERARNIDDQEMKEAHELFDELNKKMKRIF